MAVGDELHAFLGHQIDAPLHDLFVELHIGNAVHEQPANAVSALVDGNQMARAIELRGAAETGGARADHRDVFAGPFLAAVPRSPSLGQNLCR